MKENKIEDLIENMKIIQSFAGMEIVCKVVELKEPKEKSLWLNDVLNNPRMFAPFCRVDVTLGNSTHTFIEHLKCKTINSFMEESVEAVKRNVYRAIDPLVLASRLVNIRRTVANG